MWGIGGTIAPEREDGMVKERIGFIGVGLMGHGMAKNIVDKGWPLTVLGHRKREAVEDLKTRGAQEAGSARELAERSDVVVLCVTGSPQVEALISGPDGLLAGAASRPTEPTLAGRRLLDIGAGRHDAPRGVAGEPEYHTDRRAPEPHAEGGLGGSARCHGRG